MKEKVVTILVLIVTIIASAVTVVFVSRVYDDTTFSLEEDVGDSREYVDSNVVKIPNATETSDTV